MDSVNKYGSDGVPFSGKIAEIEPVEQQIQKIIDAFVPVVQSITDAIAQTIEHCIGAITNLLDAVLRSHPDKRIVWLAFHHKKERVRKKNRNRLIRYIHKAVKAND